jgi:hypothetical protein
MQCSASIINKVGIKEPVHRDRCTSFTCSWLRSWVTRLWCKLRK